MRLFVWPNAVRTAGLGLAFAAGTTRLRVSSMCEQQQHDLAGPALASSVCAAGLPALHEAIAPLGRQYQKGQLWRSASGVLRLAVDWSETDLRAPSSSTRQCTLFELGPDTFSDGSGSARAAEVPLPAAATLQLDGALRQVARRGDLEFRLRATGAQGKQTLTAEIWEAGALLAR